MSRWQRQLLIHKQINVFSNEDGLTVGLVRARHRLQVLLRARLLRRIIRLNIRVSRILTNVAVLAVLATPMQDNLLELLGQETLDRGPRLIYSLLHLLHEFVGGV